MLCSVSISQPTLSEAIRGDEIAMFFDSSRSSEASASKYFPFVKPGKSLWSFFSKHRKGSFSKEVVVERSSRSSPLSFDIGKKKIPSSGEVDMSVNMDLCCCVFVLATHYLSNLHGSV